MRSSTRARSASPTHPKSLRTGACADVTACTGEPLSAISSPRSSSPVALSLNSEPDGACTRAVESSCSTSIVVSSRLASVLQSVGADRPSVARTNSSVADTTATDSIGITSFSAMATGSAGGAVTGAVSRRTVTWADVFTGADRRSANDSPAGRSGFNDVSSPSIEEADGDSPEISCTSH